VAVIPEATGFPEKATLMPVSGGAGVGGVVVTVNPEPLMVTAVPAGPLEGLMVMVAVPWAWARDIPPRTSARAKIKRGKNIFSFVMPRSESRMKVRLPMIIANSPAI
jgi:hypothetical protein